MSVEPGSDDEPYGEVQRVASSSSAAPAAPAPNPDDVANYSTLLQEHARSIFSRAYDSKGNLWRSSIPQAEEQRLAPPSWTDAELSTFYLSLARHSRLRPDLIAQDLGGTKTTVQVAHYLNLLHDASDAVEAQRSKSRSRAAALKRHAAAIEVDDDWVQREEQLAEACRLPQHTSSVSSPHFSWNDDGVAAAAVYVMHNSKPESEAGASNAPAVYRFSSLVASLRVPASRRSRGQVRGDVQKGYRDFVLAHPQAPSLEGMKQRRGGGKGSRRASRMHGKKRRKPEEGGAGSPHSDEDDELDGEDEDEEDSSSAAHRLVLRMCELGLLWRVVEGDAPGSSDGAANQAAQVAPRLRIAAPLYHPTATVVHQFSTAHKALHITSAQPQRLPTLFLDSQQLIWATDVTAEEQEALLPKPPPANEGGTAQGTSTFKHSMRRRIAAGRASLVAAKEAALDRLLSSVRCEELDWLEGGVVADVNPDVAAQSGDDSRGGRGRRSSTFRGHSLEDMSDKERELFKARIRKEDQKKSLDELNGWSRGAMSPATPNAASSSSSSSSSPLRASSPSSGKTSLLDPFKPLLQPLSRPQRLKAEARLRKRVRLWGLEKTMQVGLGSLDVDVRLKENEAVRRRSASGDVVASPGAAGADASMSDELGQTDVAAALQAAYASQSQAPVGTARGQDASGQDDEAQVPLRSSRTRYDARSARFRAIGVATAAEVVDRLRTLALPLLAETSASQQRAQEVTQLISLRSLARLVRASTDGTRDDDRDATEHQSSSPLAPGQVDLAPLLVFLYESLRSYLEQAVSSLAVDNSHHRHSQLKAKEVHNALRHAGLKLKADWIDRVEDEEEDERVDEEGDDDQELNRSRKVRDGLVLDWQQRRDDGDDVSFDVVDAHYASAPTHVRLANAIDQRRRRSLGHHHTAYSLSSENELLVEESEDDVFESREEADEVAHVRSHWRSSSGGTCLGVAWPSGPGAPTPPGLALPFEDHDRRELQVAEHLDGDEDLADVPGDVDLPAVPQVEVRVGGEEDLGADAGRRRRPEAQVVADAQEGIRDEREGDTIHVDVVRHGVEVEVGVGVEVEVEIEVEGESEDEGMERRDAEMDRVFVAREQGLWLGVSQSSSW